MSHDFHPGPRRVFDDNCAECVDRSEKGVDGLSYLDIENLERLAVLALDLKEFDRKPDDASWADMRAVQALRLAARLTFKSGITKEAAF